MEDDMSHVYKNRSDDDRTSADMVYCKACDGFYGVPHDNSHCRKGLPSMWNVTNCACRVCRESQGLPIQGTYGYFVESTAESTE
jgi:hypothetical protein